MPLDPQIKDLLDFLAASEAPALHESTPAEAREAFRALTVGTLTPADVVPVKEVADLEVAGRPARLYRPVTERAGKDGATATLLYLHGGGFVIGDLDTHDQTCRLLCREVGVTVVSLDYRLAPEHPFPAAVEDSIAAADWCAEHLGELGGGGRLAVGGDSAGGNLAAVVAQARPDAICAQLLLYPVVDREGDYPSRVENAHGYFLEHEGELWFGEQYTGAVSVDPADVRLAPMRATSFAGLPPALVVTAEFDPLRDEGEAYAGALAAAGVPVDAVRYDGLIHGFVDMGRFSAAAAAAITDVSVRFRTLLEATSSS